MVRRRARLTRHGSTTRFEGPSEEQWERHLRRWQIIDQTAPALAPNEKPGYADQLAAYEAALAEWEPRRRRHRRLKDRWGYAYLGLMVLLLAGAVAAYELLQLSERWGNSALLATGAATLAIGFLVHALFTAVMKHATQPLDPGPRPQEPRLDIAPMAGHRETDRYGPVGLTYQKWETICAFFGGCAYCGYRLQPYNYEIEHVLPRYFGGPHHISNVVPACAVCNEEKGVRTGQEYARVRQSSGRNVNPRWWLHEESLRTTGKTPPTATCNRCDFMLFPEIDKLCPRCGTRRL